MLVAAFAGIVPQATAMERARDLGVPFDGTPGPFNAITDVPGVLVGLTGTASNGTVYTAVIKRSARKFPDRPVHMPAVADAAVIESFPTGMVIKYNLS